ncbi:conserved hypothetical protein [Listeria monocytogenes str. 4b H7858]|nr:conserved hypothetical protein [Listeria monocytogenes str. 4b H7858] [Listeria monocytogenes serotype 4b str. H7858]
MQTIIYHFSKLFNRVIDCTARSKAHNHSIFNPLTSLFSCYLLLINHIPTSFLALKHYYIYCFIILVPTFKFKICIFS